jgi:cupin 2 domain-containing protein
MVTGNQFANVPQQLANEAVEELLSAPNVRTERIVSMSHATAAEEWYDQDRAEWVLLL